MVHYQIDRPFDFADKPAEYQIAWLVRWRGEDQLRERIAEEVDFGEYRIPYDTDGRYFTKDELAAILLELEAGGR